uniref:Uncharacterized protein n=1 Tax=Panagrolaimus sp. JU765 TaxID=591449 RepID=A0AC34QW19_9BILA
MPNWWVVRCQANNLGDIQSQNSLFKENAVVISWNNQADNEMRVLMLCFGLVQMIREGYPQIMTHSKITSKLIKIIVQKISFHLYDGESASGMEYIT